MLTMIKEFIAQPMQKEMDAIDWLLFIGLIVVSIILWVTVIDAIKGAID